MKEKISILLVAVLALVLTSCGGSSSADQSTPEGVMNIIFNAASSKDYSKLSGLCDPDGGGDKDVKEICNAANDHEQFDKYFGKGKVDGSAKIDGDNAEVSILAGPEGTDKETMKMKKKGDKWYLSGF